MTSLTVAQVLSGTDLGVDFGLADLTFATINGRDIVYAYARIDNRLIEIDVAGSGLLSTVGSVSLNGGVQTGREAELHVLESEAALVIAGYDPTSGSVSLAANGALGTQESVSGGLNIFAPTSFNLGTQDVLVSADSTGGLQIYQDTGSELVLLSTIDDTVESYLAGISDILALDEDGATRILAASEADSGLTLVDVSPFGELSLLGTLGQAEGLPVSGTLRIEGLNVEGGNFVAVAAAGTSSLSLVKVEPDGAMRVTDHILDSEYTRFGNVTDIAATRVGDFAYLVAGGSDGGISLFTALPGGRLVHLASIEDTTMTTLSRIGGLEMSVGDGALQIFASSAWEAGLTRLSYDVSSLGAVFLAEPTDQSLSGTLLDDQLVGGSGSETIAGGAGEDILYDGAGSDTLEGGIGADLFVFEADGVQDTILDFEAGTDRLDLSAFDFLYNVDQMQITPTSSGAILSYQSEVIVINSANGSSLGEEDFTRADILNVDRPPQLNLARDLTGSPLADLLFGAEGFDTISGGEGEDTIFGNGGDDILFGGGAADVIDGGTGADTIDGGSGADTLTGKDGDDLIDGGTGDDLIYGDAPDWIDAL